MANPGYIASLINAAATPVTAPNDGTVVWSNAIESTIATGTYNDYATTTLSALRVQGNGGSLTFTGFDGGVEGRVLVVYNFHPTNTVTLADENVGSAAANRLGLGAAIVLAGYEAAVLQYESSSFTTRWRCIARSQAGGGGGITEAPIDGTPYVRQSAGWVSAAAGSGLTQPQVMARSSFGGF